MDANPGMQDPLSADTRIVSLKLGARSYDILIGAGLLAQAGALISRRLGAVKCAIVTDENVARHHLETLAGALGTQCPHAGTVTLKPGEATKSFSELAPLCERLLEMGIERGDAVIALGGGVVGDIAGFAASILRRGVSLVQIPTSLLAQVDSSVGGKTGINTPRGKNLIGTFHQPALVITDIDVLASLPERQLRAGYAEVVKYGLLGDVEFFNWLEKSRADIFAGGPERARAIETSCKAKAAIVAEDERESGKRALLNLGHTFGHALEAHAGYSDRLLHGEAISIGMALAFEYSNEIGICTGQDARRAIAHFKAAGLPVEIGQIPGGAPAVEELLALIAQDKKMQGGIPAFILVRGIGEAFVEQAMDMERLADFLTRKCSGK